MAIFAHKFDHFCLYLPEALIDMLKHDTKVKVLLNETTWFLFEVNTVGTSVLELRLFVLSLKFSEFTCPWGVNYPWGGKLSQNSSVI